MPTLPKVTPLPYETLVFVNGLMADVRNVELTRVMDPVQTVMNVKATTAGDAPIHLGTVKLYVNGWTVPVREVFVLPTKAFSDHALDIEVTAVIHDELAMRIETSRGEHPRSPSALDPDEMEKAFLDHRDRLREGTTDERLAAYSDEIDRLETENDRLLRENRDLKARVEDLERWEPRLPPPKAPSTVPLSGVWSDRTSDPIGDIMEWAEKAREKGLM